MHEPTDLEQYLTCPACGARVLVDKDKAYFVVWEMRRMDGSRLTNKQGKPLSDPGYWGITCPECLCDLEIPSQ